MTAEFQEDIGEHFTGFYPRHTEQQEEALRTRIAEMAVHVEAPPVETGVEFTKDMLEVRAARMGNLLHQEARAARGRALTNEAEFGVTGGLEAIVAVDRWGRSRDDRELGKWGLAELGSAWPADIVGAMIEGKPLTVHVATPRTAMQADRLGNRILGYGQTTDMPHFSSGLAAALRRVCPVPELFTVRSLVHDYLEPTTGLRLGRVAADQTTVIAWDFLRKHGVIEDAGTEKSGFTLKRAQEVVPDVDRLIAQLQAERVGSIVTAPDGAVHFKPTEWAVEASGQLDPLHIGTFLTKGICLKHDADTPTEPAIIAASFLDSTPPKGVQLLTLPSSTQANYADTYALLRSANVLMQQHYHYLPLRSRLMAETQQYAFLTRLHVEATKFLTALREYDDAQAMNPRLYIESEYGRAVDKHPGGILPTDWQLMSHLSRLLPRYMWQGQGLRVMNIGHGPFSYLDHALEPYASSIEAADPGVANQGAVFQHKAGTLESRYNVGPKFERGFAHLNPNLYAGCDERVRRKLVITDRGIDDMPDGTYDIVAESFVSCSISLYKTAFWEHIQAKKSALRGPDSLMVSLHMVGSDGWSAGGKFPSVKMSLEEIRQAYLDADMEILEFVPVTTPEKSREGYDGMVLIIARPRHK